MNRASIMRILKVLVVGSCYLYEFVNSFDKGAAGRDPWLLSSLFFLLIGAIIWNFIKDRSQYKATGSVISYSSTIVGFIIVAAIFIAQEMLSSRDRSPTLVQAEYDKGETNTWFEFREDGTYKFFNGTEMDFTITRGDYQLKDSIITLDRNKIDGITISKYLAIRVSNENSLIRRADGTIPVAAIYQINNNHQIVDKEMIFIVNEDHRK